MAEFSYITIGKNGGQYHESSMTTYYVDFDFNGKKRKQSFEWKARTEDNLRKRIVAQMVKMKCPKVKVTIELPDYSMKPVFYDTFEWAHVTAKRTPMGAVSFVWVPIHFENDPSGPIDPKTGRIMRRL